MRPSLVGIGAGIGYHSLDGCWALKRGHEAIFVEAMGWYIRYIAGDWTEAARLHAVTVLSACLAAPLSPHLGV